VERLGHLARARVVEHAPRLRLQLGGLTERSTAGGIEERLVGHRCPEEVRQARGDLVGLRRHDAAGLGGRGLGAVEELRREQHSYQHQAHGRVLAAARGARGVVDGAQRRELGVGRRSAEGAAAEADQEVVDAGVGRGAGQQCADVDLGDRVLGHVELLFDEQAGGHQAGGVVVEPDDRVGGEGVGHVHVDAEQIADGVAVLAPVQHAHHHRRGLRRTGARRSARGLVRRAPRRACVFPDAADAAGGARAERQRQPQGRGSDEPSEMHAPLLATPVPVRSPRASRRIAATVRPTVSRLMSIDRSCGGARRAALSAPGRTGSGPADPAGAGGA
jgi:hypothetical protein